MEGKRAIGVIDSGVGGLTVVREIMRQLPREHIVYFGDNERCPYGHRAKQEIECFSKQMIDFLFQFPLKALVIACNTVAAVGLERFHDQCQLPVLGVIEPGARAAISATRSGRIGIIGTQMTIQTRAYQTALNRLNPDLYTVGLACPEFVPLVENGLYHTDKARRIVRETLRPLKAEEVDTLILGCTHYPLLAPLIQEIMGDEITLISSAEETARELSALLSIHQLHTGEQAEQREHAFFTSGDPHLFRQIGEEWLQKEIVVRRHRWE